MNVTNNANAAAQESITRLETKVHLLNSGQTMCHVENNPQRIAKICTSKSLGEVTCLNCRLQWEEQERRQSEHYGGKGSRRSTSSNNSYSKNDRPRPTGFRAGGKNSRHSWRSYLR